MLLTCLLIATLMPILAKYPLMMAQHRAGGYDNHLPRVQQKKLEGFGARAQAAHENSFEALILFTPGALTVLATQQPSAFTNALAGIFIVARICYLFCYWYDKATLRSTCWGIGFLASVLLLVSCF